MKACYCCKFATDLIHDSCWGMGSVKVGRVTAGLHNTTNVCQKKKSTYLNVHTPTWASADSVSHASWRDSCRSDEVVSQHARIICIMVRLPVCHYSLSTNKQRWAGGAVPGQYGCSTEFMSIVLGFVRAQWQPFVQGRITNTQDTWAKKEVLE